MICPHCQSEIANGATRCPKCHGEIVVKTGTEQFGAWGYIATVVLFVVGVHWGFVKFFGEGSDSFGWGVGVVVGLVFAGQTYGKKKE